MVQMVRMERTRRLRMSTTESSRRFQPSRCVSFFQLHTNAFLTTTSTPTNTTITQQHDSNQHERVGALSHITLDVMKTIIFTFGTPCLMRSRCCSLAWPLLHIPLALQIRLLYRSLHREMTTATIHYTERRLAKWLNRTHLQNANKPWWRDVEICRSKHVPWEGEVQENGGPRLQCILLLEATTGLGDKPSWTE